MGSEPERLTGETPACQDANSVARQLSCFIFMVGGRVVVTSSYIVLQSVQRRWVEIRGRVQRTKANFPVISFTIGSWLNQGASKDAERGFWVTKHAHGSDLASGQPFPWISTKEIRIAGQPRRALAYQQVDLGAPNFSVGLRSTPSTGAAVRQSCPVDNGISPRCRWLSPVLPPNLYFLV